jgi:conjugal transfer pilus assembly protein TraF
MLKRLLALFFSFFLVVPVFASEPEMTETNESPSYYDDRQHGWYWYEDDEIPEEKEYELPEMDVLWNMHPDQLSVLIQDVTKKAVQEPSEENVLNYLKMMDIAKKKSVAFSSVVAFVGQKNPEFSSNENNHPTTAPGKRALNKQREADMNQTIINNKDDFAIIMFTAEGCGFCDAQNGILEYFNNLFAWQVRKVDINEQPAMGERFQIETTPSLIVVQRESGEFMPLSAGVISMTDLKSRVYRSIRYMRGDANPEQWLMHEYERDRGGDPLQHISAYQSGMAQ